MTKATKKLAGILLMVFGFALLIDALFGPVPFSTPPSKPPAQAHIVEVNDSNFESVLKTLKEPVVLIDGYANWCGPCRVTEHLVEDAAKQYAGTLAVVRLDTDKSPNVSKTLHIDGLPTFIIQNRKCAQPVTYEGYKTDQKLKDYFAASVSGCPDSKQFQADDNEDDSFGVGIVILRASMYSNVYAKLGSNPSIKKQQNAYESYVRRSLPGHPKNKDVEQAEAGMISANITVYDPLVIADVQTKPTAPAASAGIKIGDKVIAIDDQPVIGRPFLSLEVSLSGPKDSILKLSIQHADGSVEGYKLHRVKVQERFE